MRRLLLTRVLMALWCPITADGNLIGRQYLLKILPQIVDAVGGRAKVMLDTGITSGADIVAALAAGADFVWVGRAYLYGLMAAGEAGVNRVVEILESEIVRTMKLLGVQRVEDLGREHIRLPD